MLIKELINESWLAKKFTKKEAKEIFDYLINGNKLSSSAEKKLYDWCEDEMPYGVKKARTSTPEEWYVNYFGKMSEKEIQEWINERTE